MGKQNKNNAAVFIDRDGTVIKEKDYLRKIKDVELFRGSVPALKLLRAGGFKLIMVTNQSGVGRGYLTEEKLKRIHAHLQKILKNKGVRFDGIYYCPHAPEAGCECRKPRLGMIKAARKRFGIDLARSYSIGDHKGDFLLGRNMGGKGVFVLTGHGKHERAKFMKDSSIPKPHRIEKDILSAARWILSDSGRRR